MSKKFYGNSKKTWGISINFISITKHRKIPGNKLEQMMKVSWVQTTYAIVWLELLGKICSKLGNGQKRLCVFFSLWNASGEGHLVVSAGISWSNRVFSIESFLLMRQFCNSIETEVKLQDTYSCGWFMSIEMQIHVFLIEIQLIPIQ